MSSKKSQPENNLSNDDSETYRVSGPENESARNPEAPRSRKKTKRNKGQKTPQSSSEIPYQNPFDAEFARKEQEAAHAVHEKDSELDDDSSENEYLAKRTRIVDTTKRPGESLMASFLYPFYRDGIKLVFAYGFFIFIAQLTALLPFVGLMIQPFALMLVGIFVGLMLLETANDTIRHQGGGIEWPDIGIDSLGAGLAAFGSLLVAFAPLAVLNWYLKTTAVEGEEIGQVSKLLLDWGAISMGLLYLPMSFIALAELESERAFNPFLVFSRIFQMFGSYITIVASILVLFLGVNYLLLKVEQSEIYDLKLLVITTTFFRLIAFVYLSTVLIRAVGLSFSKHDLSFETEFEEEEDEEE